MFHLQKTVPLADRMQPWSEEIAWQLFCSLRRAYKDHRTNNVGLQTKLE
jgi:hypothetical protein